jgi:hypothetical protein
VLTPQSPFDLGHEGFRQPQGFDGSLTGLDGLLRLAAVAHEALLRCEATTLAGFGVFFLRIVCWGHREILRFIEGFRG